MFLRLDTKTDDPPANDDIYIHRYPFDALPTLVSHIHPKFVIVSAGIQLDRIKKEDREAIFKTLPILADIFQIYLAWTRSVVQLEKEDTSFWPPYDPGANDDSSDDSQNDGDDPNDKDYGSRTEIGRIGSRKRRMAEPPTPSRPRSSRMRRARNEPMEPDHASRALKRKKSSNLSRRSLIEHTKKTGKIGWDKDAFMEWTRNCQPPHYDDAPPLDTMGSVCV